MATLDSGELTEIDGVNRERAERLREAGYQTIEHVSAASSDQLSDVEGISNALASRIESTTDDIDVSDDVRESVEANYSEKSRETKPFELHFIKNRQITTTQLWVFRVIIVIYTIYFIFSSITNSSSLGYSAGVTVAAIISYIFWFWIYSLICESYNS